MMSDDDQIEIVEVYRGVGIHDCQPPSRIENVVKPSIDKVYAENDLNVLVAICEDEREPPEARLFAFAKLKAAFEMAVDERRMRPDIDLARAEAFLSALDSEDFRDSHSYGSLFDHDCVRRPARYARQVVAAKNARCA
jgi:hypothetical protein